MRQTTIKTDKVTVLVVELPTDVYSFGRMDDQYWSYGSKTKGWGKVPIRTGKDKFIAAYPSITENHASCIVDKDKRGYKHYWKDNGFVPRGFNTRYDTALESLNSLLQANGVYFENPVSRVYDGCPQHIKADIYQEAQSKIWNKSRTYFFIKSN